MAYRKELRLGYRETKTCRGCGRTSSLTLVRFTPLKNGQRKAFYADKNGKTWNSRECRDCFNSRWCRDYSRSVDQVTEPRRVASRLSEIKVAKFFSDQGFKVELNKKPFGPDIILYLKNGKKVTVEVKIVKAIKRKKTEYALYYSDIYPGRRNDDKLALVYGDRIVVLPMKKAISNGRNVTGFFE